MKRDTIERSRIREQRIENLRFYFQERVGKHGVTPWTITEVEADQLLKTHRIPLLLEALTLVGAEVKRLRAEQLVFLSQDAVLDLLRTLR
jgi:hypothetical protein